VLQDRLEMVEAQKKEETRDQTNLTEICERLNKLESGILGSSSTARSYATVVSSPVFNAKTSIQITKAINDRESRKETVVFSGIPESELDATMVVEEVLKEVNVAGTPISVKRIGQERDGVTRKVIVRFRDEETVSEIMRKKFKLKDSPKDWMCKIYINEDLSREQRDFLSTLYKEAALRNTKVPESASHKFIIAGRRSRPFIKKIVIEAQPSATISQRNVNASQ